VPDLLSVTDSIGVRVPLAKILDLLRDRKDRTTKAYWDHETALMTDIKADGIRNPIKGYWTPQRMFQLVSGQTRVNAARRAGTLVDIPAIVLEGELTPTRLLTVELVDNNMQVGFDLVAQGGLYVDLMKENNWTAAELCANVPAAKPGPVSKALSIFEGLIEELKAKLRAGEIGPRLGYALSRVPADRQVAVFEKVRHMRVEAAEAQIAVDLGGQKQKKPKPVAFSLAGFKGAFTVFDLAKVRALLAQLGEAVAKCEKYGLPLQSLPQMLKGS
jgi:hypothetical protein